MSIEKRYFDLTVCRKSIKVPVEFLIYNLSRILSSYKLKKCFCTLSTHRKVITAFFMNIFQHSGSRQLMKTVFLTVRQFSCRLSVYT